MHVDDTAVKSELKNGVDSPFAEDTGRERRIAPIIISAKKPAINTAEGLTFFTRFTFQSPIFKRCGKKPILSIIF